MRTKPIKFYDSLLFRIAAILIVFTIVILGVSSVVTYISQISIYRRQCERDVRDVGVYLAELMEAEGRDVLTYKDFYMKHYRDMKVPYYFTSHAQARDAFENAMVKNYPGLTFGEDIMLDDLAPDVQAAWFTYMHEYWLTVFENARDSFDLPYTYFLVMVPDEETRAAEGYDMEFVEEERDNVVYMIDGERTMTGGKWLYLGDTYFNPRENYEIMWRTWDTGVAQDGYMEWDNTWGHTYGYYTPLIIDGIKVGLVVSEISVARVDREILTNTLRQMGVMSLVLIASIIALFAFARAYIVRRTVNLEEQVRAYSEDKDASIANRIRLAYKGRDEIDSLARQFASMIMELTTYMENLLKTTRELDDTKQHAEELTELANKDPLTGIRNKNAYDKELQKLKWNLDGGETRFGIAMVDMNSLKFINDNYGHEKGNIAIKKLCGIACSVFEHSPVFRIVGDEFVVVLRGRDYDRVDELVERFNREVLDREIDTALEPWERVSAALGVALYDETLDSSVENVFKRADKAMYERKSSMKSSHKR